MRCQQPCYVFLYISVCEQGFEYDEMDGECKRCMIGWYKSSIANANCTMCPMGRSTSTEGASSLSECGKKTISWFEMNLQFYHLSCNQHIQNHFKNQEIFTVNYFPDSTSMKTNIIFVFYRMRGRPLSQSC